jgi:hypothetical protein
MAFVLGSKKRSGGCLLICFPANKKTKGQNRGQECPRHTQKEKAVEISLNGLY